MNQHIINSWWELPGNTHVKSIYQAVPAIIIWELWKRRNTLKHEGKISNTKLIYQVMHTLILFLKIKRNNFKYAPYNWSAVLEAINNYSPKVKVFPVLWTTSNEGWFKINTDGASRGNPGSSWAFCIRNEKGEVMQAQARELEDPCTNTQAEAMAIAKALRYIVDTYMDNILIENDSLLLKIIIQKTWEVPWHIINLVEEI